MTAILTGVGAVLVLVATGIAAYHHGRRRGRVTLPAELIAELREHKLGCIGEPKERVALEIGLLCDTDPTSSR
ncbi:MAG: hypothetical protein ABIR79_11480 [Candidatus Binatia bacterium]